MERETGEALETVPDTVSSLPASRDYRSAAHTRCSVVELVMSELEQDRYRVIALGPPVPRDLGEMAENTLRDFLTVREGEAAVQAVLEELQRKDAATTYFNYAPLGPKTQIEIRRVSKANSR